MLHANMTFLVDHPIAFDREIIVSPFSLTKRRRRVLTGASLKVSAHMKKILRQLKALSRQKSTDACIFYHKGNKGGKTFFVHLFICLKTTFWTATLFEAYARTGPKDRHNSLQYIHQFYPTLQCSPIVVYIKFHRKL